MVEKSIDKKYMAGKSKEMSRFPPSQSKGSPIWKLLKASFPLIQSSLHWVPGNGKKINLWKDGILGSHPLHQNVSLSDIRQWMISQNKISLFDIYVWHTNGVWQDWNLGLIPPHLQSQVDLLLLTLKGVSSVHLQKLDFRGWGAFGYSVKEGYKALLMQTVLPTKESMWKNIWSNDGLPKVNIFCWTLAHGKILTGENWLKEESKAPFVAPYVKRVKKHPIIYFWSVILQSRFGNQYLQNYGLKSNGPPHAKLFLENGEITIGDPSLEKCFFKEYGRQHLNLFVGKFG
jgi:hypothetical protein